MPIYKLTGLKGLSDLSKDEKNAFIQKQISAGVLSSTYSFIDADRLYRNGQFYDKYGEEAFNSLTVEQRDALWKHDLLREEADSKYNATKSDDLGNIIIDKNKGAGFDFLAIQNMTDQGIQELLESGYRTVPELNDYIKKQHEDDQYLLDHVPAGDPDSWIGRDEGIRIGAEARDSYIRKKNSTIFDGVYSRDLKRQKKNLESEVAQYMADNLTPDKMSDPEVIKAFMKEINPEEGPKYILSAYFNKDGKSTSQETEAFDINDMRRFLAEKAVYSKRLNPSAAFDALNDTYRDYISDNQNTWTYTKDLARDVCISAAAYTADKWNGARRLTLLGQTANVYQDLDGNIVPTEEVKQATDGKYYYNGKEVSSVNMSLLSLDDLGKGADGKDRGWFNNAQFWTNAEMYGTMDEEEQKKFKELGYSPYKVVYKAGDESDLFYESAKMTSFLLADGIANYAPILAGSALEKFPQLANTVTKTFQFINICGSSAGIGHAYERGLFGETYQGNLQKLQESIQYNAQQDIYNQYNNNQEFKADFDAEVEQEYIKGLQEYKQTLETQRRAGLDNNITYIDNSNNPELQQYLKERAKEKVLSRRTKEWEDNFKQRPEYRDALRELTENASTGAFATAVTTGLKYGLLVNSPIGYRGWLFKEPKALAKVANKDYINEVAEITNKAGKQRLQTTSKFSTFKGQTKELGKITLSQMWGGAWTNATDELQSGGGRRINDDRVSQYLNGMYDEAAEAAKYDSLDNIYKAIQSFDSYMKGAGATLSEKNTYKAGLVGGIGGSFGTMLNFMNIARLATKNGRSELKTLVKSNDWSGVANMFIQNGILNEYYTKKQGEQQTQIQAEELNKLMDDTEDFDAVSKVIGLDLASIDTDNPEDLNAITALKAITIIHALKDIQNNPELSALATRSSVIQKALETVEKLSDTSKLTEEEKADYLTQYYASNPGVPHSDEQNEIALQNLQKRAQDFQKFQETYNEIETTLSQVEKDRDITIPSEVRGMLMQRLAFNKFLEERTSELEEKITGSKTISTSKSILESFGDKKHQEIKVKSIESTISQVEEEINKAYEKVNKAQRDLDTYNATPQNDQGLVRKKKLQDALKDAKQQVKYLNGFKSNLELELQNYSDQSIETRNAATMELKTKAVAKTNDRVITAEEILNLNPQDRARMLDEDNFNNYSKAQKEEITRCKITLNLQDPSLLEDIQNQAMLTSKIEANKRAYSRMLENPEAAAYQLTSAKNASIGSAAEFNTKARATRIADIIHKIKELLKDTEIDYNKFKGILYNQLKVLNPSMLEYLLVPSHIEELNLGAYQDIIQEALKWSKTLSDIANIIKSLNLGKAEEKGLTESLDRIVEKVNTKEELITELEKVTKSNQVAKSDKEHFEKILSNINQLNSQKEATSEMTKEEKKESQEEYKEKLAEEEKKKQEAEDQASKEYELKVLRETTAKFLSDKTLNWASYIADNTRDYEGIKYVIGELAKAALAVPFKLAIKYGLIDSKYGDEIKKFNETGKIKVSTASLIMKELISLGINSPSEIVPYILNKESDNQSKKTLEEKAVYEATKPQISDKDADSTNDKIAEREAAGISEKDTDVNRNEGEERAVELDKLGLGEKDIKESNEDSLTPEQKTQAGLNATAEVSFESSSIEEQISQIDSDKIDIVPTTSQEAFENDNILSTNDGYMVGNSMYRYETEPLKEDKKQVLRVGKSINGKPDKMTPYFQWMETAGIKLQEIIDEELGAISKLNPDIYPLLVKAENNATNDIAMVDFPLLVVEYTPQIAKIHNEENGGVLTSNGKQYLVIGTLGFPKGFGQAAQGKTLRDIINSPRKAFFDANPSERFFVNTNYHTKIQSIAAGRVVRQLANDSEIQIRTISELLSDRTRNPKGLSITDLKWGIQYDNKFATVNVSERNPIYEPSDIKGNKGSVFLLIEGANGKYIPAYINPIRFSEIREGKLKEEINRLLNDLTSTNYSEREAAISKLTQYFYLSENGDQILTRKTKNVISIFRNGQQIKTFNLDADGRNEFLEAIKNKDIDPRINVSIATLSDKTSLEMYDEAGALTTDLAKLGVTNASYNVYNMDNNGNPIIPVSVENSTPTIQQGSDLFKSQSRATSERIGNTTYRKDSNGNWKTDTDVPVTDIRLIEQLNYKNLIRTRDLKPNKVVGKDEIFIVNNDKNNPLVLVRRAGNYTFAMTKEGAIDTINKVNKEIEEKAREEKIKQELEREQRDTEALNNQTKEAIDKSIKNGAEVNLGEETITEEQIIEQLTGNFKSEATPQQKRAEEVVEKINSDAMNIHLSEDGNFYIDSDGKQYARVTSIISADKEGERFDSNSPWVLPSTTIGTGIDEFVRDFFSNKIGNLENLADRYPNATNAQLQEFAKQLQDLKESFRQRGLTIVPRDVTVTGTIEVATTEANKKIIDVAGTLDLLAYDKEGNFYIFDMKTNRSTPVGEEGMKKRTKWAKQLTLYKQMLQEKYGVIVKGLEIIPIQVNYPAPKGWSNATTEYTSKGNQLYANSKEYRNAEPILHANIPLLETNLNISYSKLTPAEQAMVRIIDDVAPTKPESKSTQSIVQSEPVKTSEDINSTGTKSLSELQTKEDPTTAIDIIRSRKYGSRVRALLKEKFGTLPKISELENWLLSNEISITNISDIEKWIEMIKHCK